MAGCKKADRNRKANANVRYINARRWEVNKLRKVRKHARSNPNDGIAQLALKNNGSGPKVEFPPKPAVPKNKAHEADIVSENYTKQDRVYELKSGNTTISTDVHMGNLIQIAQRKTHPYHTELKLYAIQNGKKILMRVFPGTPVPVSRKDLLQALKNEKRVA